MSRKLLSILFADIQGYTALMQKDEKTASIILKKFQNKIKSTVEQFGGELVNLYGDGALCTFENSVEAIKCSIDLQLQFQTDPFVPVRMGIHSGTVVKEDENIYGDSVNLASRIESLGIPGSILISKRVYDEIRNQADIKISHLGSFDLKNVEEAMEIYAVINEGLIVPDRKNLIGNLKNVEIRKSGWKIKTALILILIFSIAMLWFYLPAKTGLSNSTGLSLAVMPFTVQGNDEIAYLSEGMTDVLSIKLDGLGHIKAVDPNAIIGYINQKGSFPRDPQHAESIAEEFNADRFIIGSIIRLGNQYQITATMYANSNAIISKIVKTVNDDSELISSIDELAIELISDEIKEDGVTLKIENQLVTDNIDALKFYLKGEQKRRNYKFSEAMDEYEKALNIQSNFPMALYSTVDAMSYLPYATFSASWPDSLEKYRLNLPRKYRSILNGMDTLVTRNAAAAVRVHRKLLNEYPSDVEVNVRMGEVLSYYSFLPKIDKASAIPYFEKALKYDSKNREAILELLLIHNKLGNDDKVEEILNGPQAEYLPNFIKMLKAIRETDAIKRKNLIDEAVRSSDVVGTGIIVLSANDENIGDLLQIMSQVMNSESPQISIIQNWYSAFQGKFKEIKNRSGFDAYFLHFLSALPEMQFPESLISELQIKLTNDQALIENFRFTTRPDYLSAQCVYSFLTEDEELYNHYMEQVSTLGEHPEYAGVVSFIEIRLEAIRAFRSGNFDLALNLIRQIDHIKFPKSEQRSRALEIPLLRYIQGKIFMEQNRNDEALEIFEDFVRQPTTFSFAPLCWLHRAQIYEKQGRNEMAIHYYDKFTEVYHDCDPPQQYLVNDARASRKALFEKSL